MLITKVTVVTFSEKEKETLRGVYALIKNCGSDDYCFCNNCPFNDLCYIKNDSENEEDFIANIKRNFE